MVDGHVDSKSWATKVLHSPKSAMTLSRPRIFAVKGAIVVWYVFWWAERGSEGGGSARSAIFSIADSTVLMHKEGNLGGLKGGLARYKAEQNLAMPTSARPTLINVRQNLKSKESKSLKRSFFFFSFSFLFSFLFIYL